MIRSQKEKIMARERFTGRYMGLGGQFIKAALKQRAVRVDFPPALRKKLKEKTGCSDRDIDKAVQDGIADFADAFARLVVEQQAKLTPPPEDDDNDEN
jgi:hypothetical protein